MPGSMHCTLPGLRTCFLARAECSLMLWISPTQAKFRLPTSSAVHCRCARRASTFARTASNHRRFPFQPHVTSAAIRSGVSSDKVFVALVVNPLFIKTVVFLPISFLALFDTASSTKRKKEREKNQKENSASIQKEKGKKKRRRKEEHRSLGKGSVKRSIWKNSPPSSSFLGAGL